MANRSNTAYDTGMRAAHAAPALFNIKKLMQEERLSQSPSAATKATVTKDREASEFGATETLETRFGTIVVPTAEPILFTRGLLGMHERQRFVLADFPNARFEQFKLLQSLDEPSLSFIALPLELQPDLIKIEDLRRASEDTGIEYDDLAVLLIVTVHRAPGGAGQVRLSVNTRAPLLLDAANRQAMQYVFPHDRYSVQRILGSEASADS